MLRSLLVIIILSIGFVSVYGQPTQGAAPQGTVSGKVVDSITNLPLEYTNVILYTLDSNAIEGDITNKEGIFIIKNLPYGKYFLKISFIGYNNFYSDSIELTKRSKSAYFEKIKLVPKSDVLTGFVVQDQRTVLQTSIDKKVFNVDQSIVSEGQTATEVLENVPSVETDIDGNVSLRGSENVTILIDGRPSALLGTDVATALQQIPASSIESVEVITNPSAKHDPEGMSGIINIKLKKEEKGGVNGSATVGVGTLGRYNGSVNLNYRSSKFNAFANYSYSEGTRPRTGYTYTTNMQTDSVFYINQDMDADNFRKSHMGKVGIDWFINKKNTLGAFVTYSTSKRGSDDLVSNTYLDSGQLISQLLNRSSDEQSNGSGLSYVLNWKKTFDKPNQELTVDANYSDRSGDEIQNYYDSYIIYDYDSVLDLFSAQQHLTMDKNINAAIQADYTHPITANSTLETGFRVGYRSMDDNFDADLLDTINDTWIDDTTLINHFVYDEIISAAYATYAGKVDKFSYKAGLRLEHTKTESELVNTGDEFNNEYLSLFPSFHLSYEIDKTQTVQVSYSRRISRPRSRSINPFADYSDPLNIRKGNPFLEPEFTNSFELGYSKYAKKWNFIGSVYIREVNNMIQRIKTMQPEGYTIMTWENLDRGNSYGVELIGGYRPAKWVNLNLSFNIYQRTLIAENLLDGLNTSGLNYSGKLMSSFTLSKGTSAQLSARYSGPRTLTMGTMNPMYSMDFALRQSLFNKRASISLRVSDIFDTRKFAIDIETNNYIQELERSWSSRQVYVSFTYIFGKQTKDNKRRTNRDQQNGNGGDSDDMDF